MSSRSINRRSIYSLSNIGSFSLRNDFYFLGIFRQEILFFCKKKKKKQNTIVHAEFKSTILFSYNVLSWESQSEIIHFKNSS